MRKFITTITRAARAAFSFDPFGPYEMHGWHMRGAQERAVR